MVFVSFAMLKKDSYFKRTYAKVDRPVATGRVYEHNNSWKIIWQSSSRHLTVHILEPGYLTSGSMF